MTPPAKPPKKPRMCAALVQSQAHGRVDVCGLESGHDRMLNPTPHRGKYREMVWEDVITTDSQGKPRRSRNIISMGQPFEHERLHGGKPISEIPRHNIAS